MDLSAVLRTREEIDLRMGDPASTVALLRSDAPIPAQVRELIAEVLEGRRKVRPGSRPASLPSARLLKEEIKRWAGLLRGETEGLELSPEDAYERAVTVANAAGWKGKPETRGEATLAAKMILCKALNITAAQLDEAIHPRRGRQKSREN